MVDRVDGGAGDDGLDGDVLERGDDARAGLEQTRHAVALEGDAGEFRERLGGGMRR